MSTKRRQFVASVNRWNIHLRAYQKMVRFARWQYGITLYQTLQSVDVNIIAGILLAMNNPHSLAYDTLVSQKRMSLKILHEMIETVFVLQYAAENSIQVNETEIENTLSNLLTTNWILPPFKITPFPIENTLFETDKSRASNRRRFFRGMHQLVGFTSAEIRQFLRKKTLQEKVRQNITSTITNLQEQSHIRHILVKSQAETENIFSLLKQGASFQSLAETYSEDPGSNAKGGDMGWQPKDTYVSEIEESIWNPQVQPGDILEPIKSVYGYHVVQLLGREVRQISDSAKLAAKDMAYHEWVMNRRRNSKVEIYAPEHRTPLIPSLKELGLPTIVSKGVSERLNHSYLIKRGVSFGPPVFVTDNSKEYPLLHPCTEQPFRTVMTHTGLQKLEVIANGVHRPYILKFTLAENNEAEQFTYHTATSIGQRIAMTLNGQVLVIAIIQYLIRGDFQIEVYFEDFITAQLNELALLVNGETNSIDKATVTADTVESIKGLLEFVDFGWTLDCNAQLPTYGQYISTDAQPLKS